MENIKAVVARLVHEITATGSSLAKRAGLIWQLVLTISSSIPSWLLSNRTEQSGMEWMPARSFVWMTFE